MLACLFIPLFPLAARLRSEPDLKGEAAAIFEGNGNAARVIAATRKARKAGIEPGMTLPQARSIYPRLIARPRDPESERSAQEALLEIADSFSPRVEDAGEGVDLPRPRRPPVSDQVTVDKSTVDRIPPVPSGRGSSPLPLSPRERAGVRGTPNPKSKSKIQNLRSPSPATSFQPPRNPLCQRGSASPPPSSPPESPPPSPTPPSSSLPAKKPPSSPRSRSRASPRKWKSKKPSRAGASARSAISRASRKAKSRAASARWAASSTPTARGFDPRPLMPRLPPPDFTEGMDLEWPLVSLEPFLFVGNAALERLIARLESQGLACVRLEVTLKLDPDGCDARAIALPAPTREVKTLLTLVRLELEARPPGAPVTGFAFTAHPDKPRRAQLSLFGPPALSPDKLATTIARLAALLGADRIGSPRTVDGHRPERFTTTGYSPPPPPTDPPPPRTGRGLLADPSPPPPSRAGSPDWPSSNLLSSSPCRRARGLPLPPGRRLPSRLQSLIPNHQSQILTPTSPTESSSPTPSSLLPLSPRERAGVRGPFPNPQSQITNHESLPSPSAPPPPTPSPKSPAP